MPSYLFLRAPPPPHFGGSRLRHWLHSSQEVPKTAGRASWPLPSFPTKAQHKGPIGGKQPSVISPRETYSSFTQENGRLILRTTSPKRRSEKLACPWYSDLLCAVSHIHSPKTGVGCPCCVASRRRRVKAQDSHLSSS